MSDKQLILNTVQNIDDKTSYEEILYTLYIQLETQKGIKDMESGNTKTSNEVKEIIDKLEAGETPEKQQYVEEEIFAGVDLVPTVTVDGTDYGVIVVTEEVINSRAY